MERKTKCPKCKQIEKAKNGFHRGDISVNVADVITMVAEMVILITLNRKLLDIIWKAIDSEESRD